MPTDQLTDAQVADKLAGLAGWTMTEHTTRCSKDVHPSGSIPVRVWSRNGCELVIHPFPVGRVDPLLDHIREVLEPKGWRLDYIDCGHLPPAIVWCRLLNRDSERNVVGKDNSPWSALARAMLAAHEVEVKNAE